jgi:hypothetical protein
MTRYLDTIPEPWTREVILTAIFKDFSDARAAIEATPGGQLWRAVEDLDDTIWIFQASVTELLDEICLFADRSKNSTFWEKGNSDEAAGHTRSVKRSLFNCTSALMTLVDHARNFQRDTPVDGYAERLKEDFSTPGLHDFLQCLRNYNTHWRIAQTHWVISHNFQSEGREARFRVTKPELLAWSGWTLPAREFIERADEAIDIYQLFSNYRRHVQSFYAWHKGRVLDHYADTIRQYLEYRRLYEGISKKYEWNLVISHAPKTLNPYQYVGRYLSKNQVARLLAYPHRSEEQVDALIRMLDMEEFCDEALRAKILTLFRAGT